MNAVTISSKFQISIPKEVRESQGWKPGQKLTFIPKGKGYELLPVPEFEDLVGIAEGADPSNYRDRYERY